MSTAKPKSFSLFRNKSAADTSAEKEKKNPRSSTPTIISRDLKLEGTIVSSGLVEIEGTIKGTIEGASVILLQHGIIEGEVIAESFSVRGKFTGTIKAKNVNIGNKANVSGTIEYSLLSVEDGASVDAKFKKIAASS